MTANLCPDSVNQCKRDFNLRPKPGIFRKMRQQVEITLSCTKMPCFVVRHVRLASNAFDFDFDFVSEVRFSIDMRYCIV